MQVNPLRNYQLLLGSSILALSAFNAHADQLTILGTADSFAVLGASTVTNTGATVLSGNLGVSPGLAITGFNSPGIVTNGSIYTGNGVASAAQSDALTGYNTLAALAPTSTLTGVDLGGQTLTQGVYFFASSAQLTGALTLDFQGLNDANIVFQIGSSLTTASASSINIIHQGTDDNVYFQVGSSATLGTGTMFQGDIIALSSISLNTGATIACGSALALNGAVTLDTNTVTNCSTTGSDIGGADAITTPPAPPAVPEPASLTLLATGMITAGGAFRRRFIA